jgi:type II secretory pathway component GspD/PulD (secretin)
MVRKRIRKILSGGAVVFIVLLCTLDVSLGGFDGQAITWTISGSTGVPGVTMTGLPSQAGQTVVTDQNGYYSAIVPYAWSGTVKPVKDGWQFEPASKPYQRVTANMDNESYVPTEITYTVSGKVAGPEGPMSGVQLAGLPGSPITGDDGSYSATVSYAWGDMVTPMKEGFAFTPANKQYPPAKANLVQNYTAEALKLLITGVAGTSGVKMKGLPGDPVTGENGVFSVKVDYGWSGTITPEKEGYEFEPTELPYTNIITDQTNENFNAKVLTYVISGTAGMAGVEMKGLPGNPYTDQNGYFTATVNHGFSGTLTPWKEGYKFVPASLILANVNSDRSGWSCSSEIIKLTISGTTRLEGVQMTGLPGNPVTGKDGSYSVTVDYNWNGTVMPIKEGYQFTPESMPYPAVTADMANQMYTYTKITYTITGNTQVDGVTIKGIPGKPVISTGGGNYVASVEHGFTGTITPTKEGYEFQPPNMQLTSIMGPQSGQDFTPTLMQRKITGAMRSSKGQPVEGVNIVADNNGGQATTDSTGQFELLVDYGWSGKLTPMKEGYTFSPAAKPYSRVTVDQMNQVFVATAKMFTVTGEVKMGGVPIDGVLITASDGSGSPITTTTDLQGKYTFNVPFGWMGEVAPTKEGINFNPPSQSLIDVRTNIKDFQPVAPVAPPVVLPPTPPSPGPSTAVAPGPTSPPGVDVTGPTPPHGIDVTGPTPPVDVAPQTPDQKRMQDMQDELDALKAAMAGRGTVGAATTLGPPPEPGTALISNSWLDDDLVMTVLPMISEQAGMPIIADEAVTGLVTLSLTNVPLDQALDLVLASTPYVYQKRENYYLVASAKVTDTKFATMSETRRVRMNYITAEAAVNLLSSAFRPYVQAEVPVQEVGAPTEAGGGLTSGTRMSKTYTVAVTAPPALMERIIADLKSFDRMPDQVLLKARIVAMARTDLLNLGVEWGWPTMQMGFFSGNNYGRGDPANDFGGKSPWGVQMGYTPDLTFTNALQLALNLLTVNGEATIRAEPQVMALDGKQATMKVINEEYFFLTADNPNSSQSFYTSSQLETIESGTTLTITPHIVENDRIVLQVSVEVSDSIPKGRTTDLPIVTRRTADNTVTVENGGTVALAGLTREDSTTTHKRTPGLSNLPLIGPLFSNSDDVTTSREVAVFVTATILPQNQYGAATSIPRAAPPVPAAPQRFSMPSSPPDAGRTPTDPRFNEPRVDSRYNQAPVDSRYNQAPVDSRYNQAPVDSRFNQAPVDPRFTQPTPGPAPLPRFRTDFQSQLGDALRDQ